MARARIDLVERLPEAERAVADRDLGRDGQPAPLHLDQQLAPALSALPDAHLEADEFLPALGRRADQHQHALGLLLHAGLQVDAIGPDVDVAPGREIAPLPALVLGLPFGREPGDHRRRQVRGVLAEQRRKRLLEVAGRDPAKVEDRQERIEAPRPARPFRQDRRREADPVVTAWSRRDPGSSPAIPAPARSRSGSPLGPWPCRTRRARPSGSLRSCMSARNASASSSTACARSRRAPARSTSVRGSSISSG